MSKWVKFECATGQWLSSFSTSNPWKKEGVRDFVGPIRIETAHQTSHLAAKNWAPFLNKETLRLQGLCLHLA